MKTLRNKNYLNALVDIKNEIINNSDGLYYIIDCFNTIDGTGEHLPSTCTCTKSCLGSFSLEEEYGKNFAKFTLIYKFDVKKSVMRITEDESYNFKFELYFWNYEKLQVGDKTGFFKFMKASDLLTFFRTQFLTARIIENSTDYWRMDNFVDHVSKYTNQLVDGELIPYEPRRITSEYVY